MLCCNSLFNDNDRKCANFPANVFNVYNALQLSVALYNLKSPKHLDCSHSLAVLLLTAHVVEEVTTWNKGQTVTVTCPPAKTSAADAPHENLSRKRKCEAKEDRELTTPLPDVVHVEKNWRCSWSNWMLYIDWLSHNTEYDVCSA